MDMRQFQAKTGMKSKDIIHTLQNDFPRYGKATHSMVSNPHMYGVKLIPEAESILTGSAPRRGDRHKCKYRLTCRVTKSRYDAVKQAIERDGRFTSIQAWLDWWVFVWVERQKRAAPELEPLEAAKK